MTSTQDRPPSSPAPGSSVEQDLAYYKSQYEQLESELQEFQASSRELESELERDIEASEKRERQLKEKMEGMGFEVEEWKAKYKQSKTEANGAQNALQKEITTLRESNRSMTMRLRDIEVANDDFERQARNQTSSLEDLESKYNVSIERGVMLEEEVKAGEQEREELRIENQRLRDELADLSIEADIVKEKLRAAEDTISRHRAEKTHALVTANHGRSGSPVSETSTSATTVSSPTTSTPPPSKSNRTSATTPPSPNFAEFMDRSKDLRGVPMRHGSVAFHDNTPRPRDYGGPQRTRHNRAPSMPWSSASGRSSPTRARRPTQGHSSKPSRDGALPRSGSLYQIRGLIGKMQKLEARVHNVRSKLPAPTNTPPRASTRNGSAQSNHSHMPSNITTRSAGRQRTSGSATSSTKDGEDNNTTGVSKLNFSASVTRSNTVAGFMSAPSDTLSASSRPTSRGSERSGVSGISNGYGRPVSRGSAARPPSRNGSTGRGTPLGHFSTNNTTEARRPRTSAANSNFWNNDRYGGPARTRTRARANTRSQFDDLDEPGTTRETTPVTRTRPDFSRSVGFGGSGIPTPGSGIPTPSSGLPRRKSLSAPKVRRPSMDQGAGIPPVPPILQRPGHTRQLSEVGETW